MFTRRRNVLACCVAVATLLVAGCSSSKSSGGTPSTPAASVSAPTGSTIVLGNVGSYTGPYATETVQSRQALMVWQSWTNAHGGLNGHPVKVISMDDAGDPSQSLTDVKTLVEQDHVLAFVDNQMPSTIKASEAYLAQKQIPTIGGDLGSEDWFSQKMLFPQGTDLLSSFTALLKEAAAKKLTRFGDLYCVEAPTCKQLSGALGQEAPSFGVKQVYSGSYSITNPSFTAQCLKAKQDKVQFLVLLGGYPSMKAAATNCDQQNFHPVWAGGSATTDASMVTNPDFQGYVGIQPVFPWVDSYTQGQQDFQAAMKQYAPGATLTGSSSLGWAAAELMTAASKNVTATPTTAEILQGLWSIKNDTLGGLTPPLTFTAHAPTATVKCYYVMTIENKKFADPYGGKYQCLS
jgi:branched-chain amino acid transport system substrate-binding protein